MSHPDIPPRALELTSRAQAYKRRGDFARAIPLYEEALAEVGRAAAERGLMFGRSLGNLGLVLCESGEYERAQPLLERAVAVVKSAAEATEADRATALNNLAGFYQQTRRDEQAAALFAEALVLERAAHGEESAEFALVLNNLALSLQNLGRYADSEPHTRRALELQRRVLPDGHPDIARSLNNLGLLLQNTGRYADADRAYRESVDIYREALGEAHPQRAIALGNLARLQQSMGRGMEAEQLFEQALSAVVRSLGKVHPVTATLAGNLGMLYHDAGRYDEARAIFEAEVEIARALQHVMAQPLAAALNHLGLAHLRLGHHDDASTLFAQALECARVDEGGDELLVADVINNLALVSLDRGLYGEAEAMLNEVRQIRCRLQGEHHGDYEQCLFNLATALAPIGRVEEALALLQQAAAIDDEIVVGVFGISADSERLALLDMLRQRYELYVSLVLHYRRDDADAVRSACDLVLRRKGMATEVAAAQQYAVLAGKYPELQEGFTEKAALAAAIARTTLAGAGPEGLIAHERELAERKARLVRLDAELAARIPESLPEAQLRADTRAVAAALPAHTALVDLIRIRPVDFEAVPARGEPRHRPARYVAFVLHRDGADRVRLIDLGDADAIDRQIVGARTALLDQSEELPLSALVALRRLIFDPLAGALGTARSVLVSPDGDLTTWPFEVLHTDDGLPLIVDYAFSYLSVARDVLRFHRDDRAIAAAPAVVVADPDYDLALPGDRPVSPLECERRDPRRPARAMMRFEPLPGTRAEGEQVASRLGVRATLGADASKAFIKQQQAPVVLHLATHGFFLASSAAPTNGVAPGPAGSRRILDLSALENPLLRSGLALAGANTALDGGALPDGAEDGLLTAEDVAGLNLVGTELVVLSACRTGLGDVHVGEGVFGVRRAFVLAGARTLVMSLWEVPDEETAVLMRHFYDRLLAGVSPAAALREAQLSLFEHKPHPFYWGAFICQGAMDSLRRVEPTR